jgi:hypothetical protein
MRKACIEAGFSQSEAKLLCPLSLPVLKMACTGIRDAHDSALCGLTLFVHKTQRWWCRVSQKHSLYTLLTFKGL